MLKWKDKRDNSCNSKSSWIYQRTNRRNNKGKEERCTK